MRNIDGNSPLDLINNKNQKYDLLRHMTYLTDTGYKKYVGVSPGSLEDGTLEANRVRFLAADMVYTYIYNSIYTADVPVVEFRISRDRDLQEVIGRCQAYLLMADDLNGMMHNYLLHGLDMGIAQDDIDSVVLPKIVRDTLKNAKLIKKRYTFKVTEDVYRKGY